MSKKTYPSDMSRERFEQIRPLLEPRVRVFLPPPVHETRVCSSSSLSGDPVPWFLSSDPH